MSMLPTQEDFVGEGAMYGPRPLPASVKMQLRARSGNLFHSQIDPASAPMRDAAPWVCFRSCMFDRTRFRPVWGNTVLASTTTFRANILGRVEGQRPEHSTRAWRFTMRAGILRFGGVCIVMAVRGAVSYIQSQASCWEG